MSAFCLFCFISSLFLVIPLLIESTDTLVFTASSSCFSSHWLTCVSSLWFSWMLCSLSLLNDSLFVIGNITLLDLIPDRDLSSLFLDPHSRQMCSHDKRHEARRVLHSLWANYHVLVSATLLSFVYPHFSAYSKKKALEIRKEKHVRNETSKDREDEQQWGMSIEHDDNVFLSRKYCNDTKERVKEWNEGMSSI